MPNWVSIKMQVKGTPEKLKDFREAMKMDDSDFDFNKLIPMPAGLDIESGSYGEIGYAAFYDDPSSVLAYPWVRNEGVTNVEELHALLDKQSPQYRILGSQYFHNMMTHGFKTWSDWSRMKWGTKWNACDVYLNEEKEAEGELVYHFQTAWSYPAPVMDKMLETFPHLRFEGSAQEESRDFYFSFENVDGQWVFKELEWEEDEDFGEDEDGE